VPDAQQHFERAVSEFTAEPGGEVRSGVGGRSAGCRILTDEGVRWLRVVTVAEDAVHPTVWTGTMTAAGAIAGVHKPIVHDWREWMADGFRVRAELLDYIEEPVCSLTEALRAEPELTGTWWERLRLSLDSLAAQPTDRMPRTQEQITRLLCRLFGDGIDPAVCTWVTAHGDLRWNNLTIRTPFLLDWEFWGLAPKGADAATLYCSSLLVPAVANRVYATFADVLDTHDGRLSQLCAAAQILRHPDCGDLGIELRRLVAVLIPGDARRTGTAAAPRRAEPL
jgi:hypothetical protein